MKLNIFNIVVGVLAVVFVLLFFLKAPVEKVAPQLPPDFKNITYRVGNENVPLVNGFAEREVVPGSASHIVIKYFGSEAMGDLNGDGIEDVAFILTQETGGSGTFYYLAVALKNPDESYESLATIFLGDRIAPQPAKIQNGLLTIHYVGRKPGDTMTTPPSVAISRYFTVENDALVERMSFGAETTLKIGEKETFSDGLTITLSQINDSRCKKDVVCIWAGELSPTLLATGGDFFRQTQEIILGTTKTKIVIVGNYTFELKEAIENAATIMVTKQ